MARSRNTRQSGSSFDQATILRVWRKAQVVPSWDATMYRKDACGAIICFADYGKTTQYGWEIDHVKPVARGGSDDDYNLQPLQWENNRHKSDDYPHWTCLIRN